MSLFEDALSALTGAGFAARAALLGAWLLLGPIPGTAARADNAPCCGTITQRGEALRAFLDQSDVEHRWLAHQHIDWMTGEQDPARPGASRTATHCSAFVAAMATRLAVPILRPPMHSQRLLATAQARWLRTAAGASGWREVSVRQAQSLANRGWFVVASYANPDPGRPGHIAIVRPSDQSESQLLADGPEETQAGRHNWLRGSVAAGFAHHRGAWKPGGAGTIHFFAHAVDWSRRSGP